MARTNTLPAALLMEFDLPEDQHGTYVDAYAHQSSRMQQHHNVGNINTSVDAYIILILRSVDYLKSLVFTLLSIIILLAAIIMHITSR
jgi:hypothetical protein